MYHVAVVGAGAIGNPVAFGLSQHWSVSQITVIDADRIVLSNLARQPWYQAPDIGAYKAPMLVERVGGHNPAVKWRAVTEMLREGNVDDLLADVDLVIDATDNWETRLTIQDWAAKWQRPWIFNSAVRLEGMSLGLIPGGPCLRCWFGTSQTEGPRCFEAGVLGSVTLAVAGQAITLFDQWVRHPKKPSGLWLVDGIDGKFRVISPTAMRCSHYGNG
ncbi:MAG: ThiF family adenylyltransferase [Firmicutes bacterium]|jgi:adenylyltransferase/sulfurtransferase|nr:ThiF family adenylyltransferase [Bacillota bacterium]MCL5971948.1 ThiF family adenylyltransferase [Bacillota bacterium]